MNFLLDGLAAPMLLLILAFVALTAVLWLLLPFFIFGIKAKLEEQLRVLRKLDDNLERLRRTLEESMHRRPEPARDSERIGAAAEEASLPAEEAGQTEIQATPDPLPPAPGFDERWQRPSGGS